MIPKSGVNTSFYVPMPSARKVLDAAIRDYSETGNPKYLKGFREMLDEYKLELNPDTYEYYDMWYEETMRDLNRADTN